MTVDSKKIGERRRAHFRGGKIDGQDVKYLVEAGFTWLKTNQETVNALNVFPVPDGDTGTNMVLTMTAAWNEVAGLGTTHAGQLLAAVAKGALMGARGNSGVILSQLWRGFSRAVHNKETIDGEALVAGFIEARDTAYKGVVRPVEGTILTVSKDIATAGEAALAEIQDPVEIFRRVVAAADQSVQRTPDLLPILKQAGVVDSGGKGLFFLMEGMLRFVDGLPLDAPVMEVKPLSAMNLDNAMEEVEEGQDYEVVVDFRPGSGFELRSFYDRLQELGTSIQVGEGDGMYRMHIHVPLEKRYEPIDYIMSLGTITKVAMENLLAQMSEIERSSRGARVELTAVEPGQIAVVAVSPGIGISRIFASLGAAALVEGGQTMNPSTKDILDSFEDLPTDKVIVLPNNKNIILAAQQAKEVTVKHVAVVPSRTIPQGLAAMLQMDPDGDLPDIAAKMEKAMADVHSGEITVATRSVEIDGVQVREGQFIALLDGKLCVAAEDVRHACMQLLDKASAAEHELITLFYGQDLSHAEANRIADEVRAAYAGQEVELQEGDQPYYQFLVSIE
jgi:fatty acid kinase